MIFCKRDLSVLALALRAAPFFSYRKKDSGLLMCVDYRALNKATIRINYPLPRIDEVSDQNFGSHFFSSLELRSGYNQV
jgi:hypothetical protein